MSHESVGAFHPVLLVVIDAQVEFAGMIVLNSIIYGNPVCPADMLMIASAAAEIMSGKIVHTLCLCLFCV